VPNIKTAILNKNDQIKAYVLEKKYGKSRCQLGI